MVPADDEHKSANKPKDNTSTRGSFFKSLKCWKRCKEDDREPTHLTRMPNYLMHWWTPVAVALVLLAICTPIAFWWGGHFHWPSADGISVCITIAGAALAVSTWQQRNDENAFKEQEQAQAQRELEADRQEREQNRLEQIERDEYWKRREHILHTLDSNNPGIRLAAVSLLAELADSAAHSNLLNPTAQQQLQQHIISTLCLQLRHEGQLIKSEGTKEDHIEIQNEILKVIIKRIQAAPQQDLQADWSTEAINFANVNFYTEFKMINRNTHCTIDLTGAVVHEDAAFINCTMKMLIWHDSSFMKQLKFESNRQDNTLGTMVCHDNFPKYIGHGEFNGIAFCKEASMDGIHHIIKVRASKDEKKSRYDDKNYLSFSKCTFIHPITTPSEGPTSSVAYGRTGDEGALDEIQLPEYYTWGTLQIIQADEKKQASKRDTDVHFTHCAFEHVYITLGLTHSNTEFTSCYFASQANIAIATANRSTLFEDLDHIIFEDCIFTMSSDVDTPIKLIHNTNNNGGLIPPTFIQLRDNQIHIQKVNGQPGFQTLELTGATIGERYLKIGTIANCIPFEEIIPSI